MNHWRSYPLSLALVHETDAPERAGVDHESLRTTTYRRAIDAMRQALRSRVVAPVGIHPGTSSTLH
jgi:hypothetical protein